MINGFLRWGGGHQQRREQLADGHHPQLLRPGSAGGGGIAILLGLRGQALGADRHHPVAVTGGLAIYLCSE
jgi:hypothetical protein